MCTVTVVPLGDTGLRLLCNRDERRTRPPALEPRRYTSAGVSMMMPIDPEGGGTWVGAHEAGVALALLNRTDDPLRARRMHGRQTRGAIIPSLLGSRDLDDAVAEAIEIDPAEFAPFRLVIVQARRCAVVSSDGRALSSDISRYDAPLLFTSSSLGDALVQGPRRRLFEALVVNGAASWVDGQNAFHRHQWPTRPDISVVMARADARTVSRTTVEITPGGTTMLYEPLESVRGGLGEAAA